jgi:hypothetical protein
MFLVFEEQHRIIQLLLEDTVVTASGMKITRDNGSIVVDIPIRFLAIAKFNCCFSPYGVSSQLFVLE